jgi:hypothetical protein
MTTSIVIPIRRAPSSKIDLALALAMLNKAVEARERAGVKLALFARPAFRPLDGYSEPKFLGA